VVYVLCDFLAFWDHTLLGGKDFSTVTAFSENNVKEDLVLEAVP